MITTQPTVQAKGVSIPALGFGTWQLNDNNCSSMVESALKHGYRHIDTAQVYENEEFVGEGIQKSGVPRKEIFLTTKVWFESFSAPDFGASVDESLKKLKTDYVDLLLLHWPKFNSSMEETLDELMKVKEAGKAKDIGVSNFTESQLIKAHQHTNGAIIMNQIEYHPFLNQNTVLGKIRDFEMGLTAYSPLAQGDVFQSSVLKRVGENHDVGPAEVALAWLLSQDKVLAIPRTTSEEHMKSNFVAQELKLTDEELNEIGNLRAKNKRIVDPSFAPDWD